MQEPSAVSSGYGNLLGRRVIVVLPLLLLIMIAIVLFMMLPQRYFFAVNNGELHLMSGKFAKFGAQRVMVMDPIPVADLDVQGLVGKVFSGPSDALLALRGACAARIEELNEQVFPMEKELAGSYKTLLSNLRGVQAAGDDKFDGEIEVLQGWLDIYAKKARAKQPAAEQVKKKTPKAASAAVPAAPEMAEQTHK